MAKEQFLRIERFIGEKAIEELNSKCVAVAGVGAVGGFAAEALARSGVGKIKILDFDTISETNINRQIKKDNRITRRNTPFNGSAVIPIDDPRIKCQNFTKP